MIVGQGGELVDGQARAHGDDDFVDQFTAMGADAAAADDLAGPGVGEQFHKAVPGFHD